MPSVWYDAVGKPWDLPDDPNSIAQAQQSGWSPESPEQRGNRETTEQVVRDHDNLLGSVQVAGAKYFNQFFGGIPEAIRDKYFSEPGDVELRHALEKSHPSASNTGNVAGFLGGLIAPLGYLGKGAQVATKAAEAALGAESLIGKLASRTAAGAVEGAAVSSPQALTHYIEGDPEAAGETLLLGAMLGGGFGLGGKIAANAYEKVNPEVLKRITQTGVEMAADKAGSKIAGSTAGAMLGGFPGAVVGNAVGETISPMIKKFASDYHVAEKLGTLVSEQFQKLPEYMNHLNGLPNAAITTVDKSIESHLKTDKDWINHVGMVNRLAESPPIKSNSPYEQALNQKQIQTGQYLQQNLPPMELIPVPFQPEMYKLPTPADRKAYIDKLEIIRNPFMIWNKLSDGSLSDANLDALKAVYPALYEKMKQEVQALGSEKKYQDFPTRIKRGLGSFLGMDLDPRFSPQSLQMTNSVYQSVRSNDKPKQGNQKGSVTRLNIPMQSVQSEVQRVSNK